jgi:hypothetical protein
MTINKGLKVFGIALGSCIGLILVVYLAFFFVNWNDRPASAAVARMEAVLHRPQPADDVNAYVYMMGMAARPDQDPRAMGKRHIALMKEAVALPWTSAIPDLGGPAYDFKVLRKPEVNALSKAIDGASWQVLERDESIITGWIKSEQWLLDRYSALLKHPAWREDVMSHDERLPLPPYHVAMEGQKVYLAHAWQIAGTGDAAAVQALLEADLQYWRRCLESSDMLISKMISTAAIKRHLTLGVLVLRRLPPERASEAMPKQWSSPISDAERSMLNSFSGEWKYLDGIIKRSKGQPGRSFGTALYEHFFGFTLQTQDTSNNYAEFLAASADTLAVPYPQYRIGLLRATGMRISAIDGGATPKRMYNIAGDILFKVGVAGNYTMYADRTNDLEGVRRIALLAVGLRARGVKPEQMQQQLDLAAERHPFDGTPFAWNAKTGQIVYTALYTRNIGNPAVWY